MTKEWKGIFIGQIRSIKCGFRNRAWITDELGLYEVDMLSGNIVKNYGKIHDDKIYSSALSL